jgi:hypothetical protein
VDRGENKGLDCLEERTNEQQDQQISKHPSITDIDITNDHEERTDVLAFLSLVDMIGLLLLTLSSV